MAFVVVEVVFRNTEGDVPLARLSALILSLPKTFFGDRQAEKKLSNETLALIRAGLAPNAYGRFGANRG